MMGGPGKMGRAADLFHTKRIVIILPLTVIILIFILGAYAPPEIAGSFWSAIPRPYHSHVVNKTQPVQLHSLLVEVSTHGNKTLTTTQLNQTGNDGFGFSLKANDDSKHEFSMVDSMKVFPPAPLADIDEYLAICLLVKEDPRELREFFTHHYYHHGVRRFYVYDDGSKPHLSSHPIQSTYNVPSSVLNFTYIEPTSVNSTDRKRLQQHTMERCIKEHGTKHHWLGLLDPDEFVEMRHPLHPTLLGWLRHWEDKDRLWVDGEQVKSQSQETDDRKVGQTLRVGGLGISWLPHNSAHLIETPASGGFRQNYNECVAGGPVAAKSHTDYWMITHTKSFVRPEAVKYIQNIHLPKFRAGWTRFSEQGDFDFPASLVPPIHEYWALHHYATGSRKYFEAKQSKGRSQGPGMWPVDEKYWDRYHANVTTYTCNEMTKYDP